MADQDFSGFRSGQEYRIGIFFKSASSSQLQPNRFTTHPRRTFDANFNSLNPAPNLGILSAMNKRFGDECGTEADSRRQLVKPEGFFQTNSRISGGIRWRIITSFEISI